MITCIGLASGIGAGNIDCGYGPLFLKDNLKMDELNFEKIITIDEDIENKFDHLALLNHKLSCESFKLAEKKEFFISFGGDHSSAIGMWTGISEERKRFNQEIGLLWIDAHMDSHTPKTSESGNVHGMPLATLLGFGDSRLTGILSSGSKIKPENVILIGIRSFETAEFELLKALNVKIYFIEEVLARGFKVVLDEAITSISTRTDGYGVSFDLDVLDPKIIQAVGSPVPNGIDPKDALMAMDAFTKQPPIAFEIVEYNPKLDINLETFKFIKAFLKKMIAREIKTSSLLTR